MRHRLILALSIVLALASGLPLEAHEADAAAALDDRFRELNGTVMRLTVLLERLVVEQETIGLQQQLALVDQRIERYEERVLDFARERQQLEDQVEQMRHMLELENERRKEALAAGEDVPDSPELELFRNGLTRSEDEIEALLVREIEAEGRLQIQERIREGLEHRLTERLGVDVSE
jgi:septal ring factor EnvC (AmiA/AmiB activator)